VWPPASRGGPIGQAGLGLIAAHPLAGGGPRHIYPLGRPHIGTPVLTWPTPAILACSTSPACAYAVLREPPCQDSRCTWPPTTPNPPSLTCSPPTTPRADDEAHSLLREIFTAPADLHITGGQLHVRIPPLGAAPHPRAHRPVRRPPRHRNFPTPAPTSPSSTPSKLTELCNHSRSYVRSPGLRLRLSQSQAGARPRTSAKWSD